MKKDIILSIQSVQTSGEGEKDTISLMTEGTYAEKNGKRYITYRESELTGFEGCTTTLKTGDNQLSMVRFGNANTQFVFEPEKCTHGIYRTPYGSFDVSITTKSLEMTFAETAGDIKIDYCLKFGGNPSTNHQFHIKITEKK